MSTRSSRRNRSNAQLEEAVDQEPVTRPIKKSRNVFRWEEYVDEDVLLQLQKLPEPTFLLKQLADMEWYNELSQSWKYQYVMAWLYNVCESFTTINNHLINNSNQNSNVPSKRNILWKDVKFDELTFLEDLINDFNNSLSDPNYNLNNENDEDDSNEDELDDSPDKPKTRSLYQQIRQKLLSQLANNKSAQLVDWDLIVNHNLGLEEQSTKFNQMTILEKFNIFYQIIKVFERKNLVFKNYLFNNVDILELFEFNEIIIEENKQSLLILPSIGVIAEKNLVNIKENSSLNVSLKLKNCSVKYQNESLSSVELISLDYSEEIDNYLKSFAWNYRIITHDWSSFIEYMEKINVENREVFGFISPFINTYMEHVVYTRKQLVHREKLRSMSELITRRKRSTRLVAREEEIKKKELADEWTEKLDERDQYIKHRHRIVVKYDKLLKEVLWNELWLNFEKDLKVQKIKSRKGEITASNSSDISTIEGITANDTMAIKNGETFNQSIIKISKGIDKILPSDEANIVRELPAELLVTTKEMDSIINQGISASVSKADDHSWIFQCPTCHLADQSDFEPYNKEYKKIASETDLVPLLYNTPLVCCDMCSRWQHWECQDPKYIELLSWAHASRKKELHILTQRDLGAVTLDRHAVGGRRSTRKQVDDNSETTEFRPTDKRKAFDDRSVFICSFCASKLEDDLRGIFVSELRAIRNKQKKQQENKEKRKQLKEEKKRLEMLNQKTMSTGFVNNAPVETGFISMNTAIDTIHINGITTIDKSSTENSARSSTTVPSPANNLPVIHSSNMPNHLESNNISPQTKEPELITSTISVNGSNTTESSPGSSM